jgi:hypothetical protein
MAILVKLKFIVTCDSCQKQIVIFYAYAKGGDEVFFADEVRCEECMRKEK